MAEEYICSYPNYSNGEPVILKININKDYASVQSSLMTANYKVLENNNYGVVLADSISGNGINSPKQNDIGLTSIVIDKEKMKMVRGFVYYGEKDGGQKYGTCTK